jgi:GT2 family glycosyltransferase
MQVLIQMSNKISIIIARYKEDKDLVIKCLKNLSKNKFDFKVYFLDQRNDDPEIPLLLKQIALNDNLSCEYITIPNKSLSFARNYGIGISESDIVGFLDLDCIVDENWAKNTYNTFEKYPGAGIVGGRVIPLWQGKIKWFHNSKIIQNFYSVLDLDTESAVDVSRIVGGNFAIKRSVLKKEACFREDLGRKEGKLISGEDSELCLRAASKGILIKYSPNSTVFHIIPKERMSFKWIANRIYYGALSKAYMGRNPGVMNDKKEIYAFKEYLCFMIFVPFYLLGYIAGKIRSSEW